MNYIIRGVFFGGYMFSNYEIVRQFKTDVDRMKVTVMSIPPGQTNEKRIIQWWVMHYGGGGGGNRAFVELKAHIEQQQLPSSFRRCLFWCTQTALADYYIAFFQAHQFESRGRHLLDGTQYHLTFADDKRIYISKTFREAYITPRATAVVETDWQLHISASPTDEPSEAIVTWTPTPTPTPTPVAATSSSLLISQFILLSVASVGAIVALSRRK
jgi:hypothetical protein